MKYSIIGRCRGLQLVVPMAAALLFGGLATAGVSVEYIPIKPHIYRFSAGSDGYLYAIDHTGKSLLQIDNKGVNQELALEPSVPYGKKKLNAIDIVETEGTVYVTLDEAPGGSSPKYIRQIDTKIGTILDTMLPPNLNAYHLTVNRFDPRGSSVWFIGMPGRTDIAAPSRIIKFIPATPDAPGSFEEVFAMGQDYREKMLSGLGFDILGQPWFTTVSNIAKISNSVGYLDSLGRVKELPTLFPRPTGLALGPDLAMWYWNEDGVTFGAGKTDLRLSGLTEYPSLRFQQMSELVAGADRGLWHEIGGDIERINPTTGAVSKKLDVPVTPGGDACLPINLVRSAVNNSIYFTCQLLPFIGVFTP